MFFTSSKRILLCLLMLVAPTVPCCAMKSQETASLTKKLLTLLVENKNEEALILAVKWGSDADLLKILKKKPYLNKIDSLGQTPIFYGVYRDDNPDIIRYLVAYGASKQIKNNNGDNPIHVAVRLGVTSTLSYLINKRDLYVKNKKGETPLDIAKRLKKGECEPIKSFLLLADTLFLSLNNNPPLKNFVEKFLENHENIEKKYIKNRFACARFLLRNGNYTDKKALKALFTWAFDRYKKELCKPTDYFLFDKLPDHLALFLWGNSDDRLTQFKTLAKNRTPSQLKYIIEKFVKKHTGIMSNEEFTFLQKEYAKFFKQAHRSKSIQFVLPTTKEHRALEKLKLYSNF